MKLADELAYKRENLAKQRHVYEYGDDDGDEVIPPRQWVSTLDAHIAYQDGVIRKLTDAMHGIRAYAQTHDFERYGKNGAEIVAGMVARALGDAS